MKYIIIIAALLIGGYYVYTEHLNKDIADEITDLMMKDADGVPRKVMKHCVSVSLASLSESDKQTIKTSLVNQSSGNTVSFSEATAQMEISMNFFGSLPQCIMTKMMNQ